MDRFKWCELAAYMVWITTGCPTSDSSGPVRPMETQWLLLPGSTWPCSIWCDQTQLCQNLGLQIQSFETRITYRFATLHFFTESVTRKVNVPESTIISITLWDIPGREDIDLSETYYNGLDAAVGKLERSLSIRWGFYSFIFSGACACLKSAAFFAQAFSGQSIS